MKRAMEIIKHRNFPLRVMFAALIIIPVIFYYDFYLHIHAHFMGTFLPNIITRQWHIVVLNIVLFISFLIPLSFRRRVNWKEYGLVTAFFVSLFVEMYGIPLTVFFASGYFSGPELEMPSHVYHFTFLGADIGMTLAMVYATLIMAIGMLFIIIGWITLYRNLEDNAVVTKGIYSYSRHPQYFGFILIVTGWIVGWPTLLTVLFAPILIYIYVRVSKTEEKELSSSEEYEIYREKVPFYI